MASCESKSAGVCAQPAAWKQSVYTGARDTGKFLMFSYWCEAHADTIVQRRRREWLAPAQMTRLVAEEA